MKKPKRTQVRPIEAVSIVDKRFDGVSETGKRLTKPIHPVVICADLRRGCIKSLNAYLMQNRGISDRQVALELRKLLSGTRARTNYRLIVVEHPDSIKSSGGRPPVDMTPTVREQDIVARFHQKCESGEKIYRAIELLAEEIGISESSVKRACAKVKDYECAQAKSQTKKAEAREATAQLEMRRDAALKSLRNRSGK